MLKNNKNKQQIVYKINFLKNDQTSLAANIVNWISKIGLPIMIFVSLVVLGSAFYKLHLDRKLEEVQNDVIRVARSIQALQGVENYLTAIMSKYEDIAE